VHGAS